MSKTAITTAIPPRANSSAAEEQATDLSQYSFHQSIVADKSNKRYLVIALISVVIELVILKLLYPFPDFISDSYSYINTNLYHMTVNLWPIGYSWFLRFVHTLTPSQVFMVVVQYAILEAAMLYFFFTIRYLYSLKKTYANILFAFLFFNPVLLYLGNCVLSDTLFCALSLVIFCQYLWMYRQPTLKRIIIQAVLIGLAFMLRYTAIYYPIVGVVAFLLSSYKLPLKLAGIVSPWLLIIPFIIYTQQETKKVTGTAEFSVFGGWQIANNALYMYGHIQVDSNQLPARTRALDRLAKKYFQVFQPTDEQIAAMPGTFFMKTQNAILKPYMHRRYTYKDAPSAFWAWGQVSPIYQEYGSYLVKHYPVSFARYYLLLNAKNYFFPHLEKFGNYNLGEDSVGTGAAIWFNLKTPAVSSAGGGQFQYNFYHLFIPLFTALNLYFIGMLILTIVRRKINHIPKPLHKPFLLTITFLLVNFGFSIFATPVVLRYQIVPMILLVCFSLFLTEHLDKTEKEKAAIQ